MSVRVGVGYDSHRASGARPLVLGGVTIPGAPGLQGHSDADVATHALIDALLGAASLGDIGTHFPDDDPRFEGVDSVSLLERTAGLVAGAGWRVANVDVTVICEQPRLAPFVDEMRPRLGAALGIEASAVGVKGKSNEGMGFIGRGEGIAAVAVACLERLSERGAGAGGY
jgi:2-C-methyl-D-erythritol 2,4-cyclodiphosphate synthase